MGAQAFLRQADGGHQIIQPLVFERRQVGSRNSRIRRPDRSRWDRNRMMRILWMSSRLGIQMLLWRGIKVVIHYRDLCQGINSPVQELHFFPAKVNVTILLLPRDLDSPRQPLSVAPEYVYEIPGRSKAKAGVKRTNMGAGPLILLRKKGMPRKMGTNILSKMLMTHSLFFIFSDVFGRVRINIIFLL